MKKTLEIFGNMDTLVNKVGLVTIKVFMDEPREEYEKDIHLNYVGMVNCTRAVLDHTIEHKDGRTIDISSDTGRIGQSRGAVYSGNKAAAIAFVKSIGQGDGMALSYEVT